MASKTLIDTAIKLYQSLGGNVSKILGTRTNVNFLGKGKSSEMMVDFDINPEALGVLPQSKAVEELESAMGYLTSNKLNDMQANKLISNMQAMKNFYDPPAAPANITDLRTGTTGLDQGGLESLRETEKVKRFLAGEKTGKPVMTKIMQDDIRALQDDFPDARKNPENPFDADLPPPGSRGGQEDIAAPFTGAGLEAIKNVKGSNLIVDDIVNKIYLNAGVSANAQPVARANAREFLNRIKDLEDPTNPSGPTLSSIMETDDFKFMTEGGGGGMGDPLLLVQKYFGPKVASSVAQLDSADEIQKFAENLVKVKDAKGNTITSRFFDPDTVDPEDFEFAEGGRVGFFEGALVDAEEKGASISPGTDASGNVRDDNPFTGGGGGGDNQNTYVPPVKVSIGPDYTPLGPVPRFADLDLVTKYGILNLRTDLFDTLKDQELDSELSFTGNVGPVDINARTDLEGNKSLGLGFKKGNFSGGAFTDFDGNKNIGFNYSKTFADGGLARPGYVRGKLVGKALGLFKRQQALEKGAGQGFAAVEQYGITGKDITRMFKELAVDPSLQGKEKTEYFKVLNQALKNPEEFPDTIKEIQMKLGIEIGTGFRNGGLAGILEV